MSIIKIVDMELFACEADGGVLRYGLMDDINMRIVLINND